jgi:isochorismate hydrolase
MNSLRKAISEADKIKAETGRKVMVVFNAHSGEYEPIQKKLLKKVYKNGRNKRNRALTDGIVKKRRATKKPGLLSHDRLKQIEKRSPYVT